MICVLTCHKEQAEVQAIMTGTCISKNELNEINQICDKKRYGVPLIIARTCEEI